ncbi:hypothetical protein B0H13DRAFT_1873527 [Mycena leptocephala]|nr:hypothetical protein B0H13DRAFT_1873527 [Mycena leptocephala]
MSRSKRAASSAEIGGESRQRCKTFKELENSENGHGFARTGDACRDPEMGINSKVSRWSMKDDEGEKHGVERARSMLSGRRSSAHPHVGSDRPSESEPGCRSCVGRNASDDGGGLVLELESSESESEAIMRWGGVRVRQASSLGRVGGAVDLVRTRRDFWIEDTLDWVEAIPVRRKRPSRRLRHKARLGSVQQWTTQNKDERTTEVVKQ